MNAPFDFGAWKARGLHHFQSETPLRGSFTAIAEFLAEPAIPLRLPYALELVGKGGVMAVFRRPDSPLRFREAEALVQTVRADYPDATIQFLLLVLKMLSGTLGLMHAEVWRLDPSTGAVTSVSGQDVVDLLRRFWLGDEPAKVAACRELECLYLEYRPLLEPEAAQPPSPTSL